MSKNIKTVLAAISQAEPVAPATVRSALEFQQALDKFFTHCKALVESTTEKRQTLLIVKGTKYLKICMSRDATTVQGGAWAFIDKKTGDVFKPASWSAPAKHARGNIFKKDVNNCVEWTGPRYLK